MVALAAVKKMNSVTSGAASGTAVNLVGNEYQATWKQKWYQNITI